MVKPVYALVGDDPFLQLQKLADIRGKMPADVQPIEFDGERVELAEVLDELRSFAMFGGGKLVVVRNGDDFITRFREKLEDYLAKPSSSGTLVLRVKSLPATQRVHKLIIKVGEVQPCEAPKQLVPWIVDRAKKSYQLSLAPAAAQLLAELIGADLGRLDNELAKLQLQVEGNTVSADAVMASASFQREQEIKEMTMELALGRPTEALKRWRYLSQSDSSAEFRAVTWLTMWLEDVGTVLSGENANSMSWKYRNEFSTFLRVSNRMGHRRHSKAVQFLADLDRRAKSGLGDASENVEQFILSFAS